MTIDLSLEELVITKINQRMSQINIQKDESMIINLIISMSFCSFFCCNDEDKQEEVNSEIEINVMEEMPMLVKDQEYQKLCKESTKSKIPFIDNTFPPEDLALGQFLKINRKLVWKRIPEVVKEPCVFAVDKNPADSIISVTSSGSNMKAALLSLALKPERIFDIFGGNKETNSLGIYRLKVKVKGIVEWISIDDYIPIFTDTERPLLCGTVKHQIWMMLVFKAYAKICGSYSQIQFQDCFNILNTFSSGPCFSYLIDSSLKDDKETSQEILDCLSSPWNSICVTTNENPILGLKGDYNYSVKSFKKDNIELIGYGLDNNFSHNISFSDLIYNFSQIFFSTHNPRCVNTQQKILQVKPNFPFFLQFELEQPYQLIFNFWRKVNSEESFLRVIVGKETSQGFNYVTSKLESYYENMAVECPQMQPGKYKIMIMVNSEKPQFPNSKINFVCYKKMYGQLSSIEFIESRVSNERYQGFMKEVLMNYTQKTTRKVVRELPSSDSVLYIYQLFRKGGLGYITIIAGSKKGLKHLKIKINQNIIKESPYELLENNENDLSILPHTSVSFLFLLKSLPTKESSKVEFPPGISIMEVF